MSEMKSVVNPEMEFMYGYHVTDDFLNNLRLLCEPLGVKALYIRSFSTVLDSFECYFTTENNSIMRLGIPPSYFQDTDFKTLQVTFKSLLKSHCNRTFILSKHLGP